MQSHRFESTPRIPLRNFNNRSGASNSSGAYAARCSVRAGIWMAVRVAFIACLVGWIPTTALGKGSDVALDEFFKGRVVALEKGVVTLSYDFKSKEQIADWESFIPFPLVPKKGDGADWFDSRLELHGTIGSRHKAQWTGDVHIEAQLTPDAKKDVGAYMAPVSGTNDYVSFTLAEHYFHKWDKKAGGQHSIIQFGDQWTEPGSPSEYIGFRYISRRMPPKDKPVVPGQTVPFMFGWEKSKLRMEVPGVSLKGKCLGPKLKHVFVGFYAIKARMFVDNITITGKLNPKWLKANGVALRTAKPIVGPVKGVSEGAQSLLENHAAGDEAAMEALIGRLRDKEGSEEERKAIAKALGTGTRKAVRPSMELLYHDDVEVRTLGIAIIKGLLGKNFGYKPKAKPETRSRAIKKMNDLIRKKPELLKD